MNDDLFFGDEIPSVDAPPAGGFDPLPEGRYKAMCTEASVEQKEQSKGSVTEVMFKFEIMQPEQHAGRLVWQRWPVKSWSQKAEDFGKEMIGNFAGALGLDGVASATPLLNKPIVIRLGLDKEREVMVNGERKTYKARNKVVAFFPPNETLESGSNVKPAAKKPAPPAPEKKLEPAMAESSGGNPWDD